MYPVVVLSHPEPSTMADSLRLAFPNRTVLDFRFDVVDLPRLEGERYLSEPNAAALALSSRMRLEPGKKVGDAVRFVVFRGTLIQGHDGGLVRGFLA